MIIYGTRTLGKKDEKKRYMKCPHCGKFTKMASYTARKWFTLYFIPIIPLAKKRVEQQCPSCDLGYQHDFKDWERNKARNIEKLTNGAFNMDVLDDAISIHQIAELYGSDEQANSIASKIEEQYRDNDSLQSYLASWRFSCGNFGQAIPKMKELSEKGFDHLNMSIARYYSSKNDFDTTLNYLLIVAEHQDATDFNVYLKTIEGFKKQQQFGEAYQLYQHLSKFPAMHKDLKRRKHRKDIANLEAKLAIDNTIQIA